MDSRCRQRSHAWTDDPPKPGVTRCKRKGCGKIYMMPRRQAPTAAPIAAPAAAPIAAPAAAPSTTKPDPAPAETAPPDKFARFRAQATTVAATTEAKPAQSEAEHIQEESVSLGDLVDIIGPAVPYAIAGLSAKLIEWGGRVPEAPNADILERLGKCSDIILRRKLPKMEIGPWGGLGLYSVGTYLTMRWGAKKADTTATDAATPDRAADSRQPTTPLAGTTETPNTTTTEEGLGNATIAATGKPDEGERTTSAGSAI